jgi:hypothetical protein
MIATNVKRTFILSQSKIILSVKENVISRQKSGLFMFSLHGVKTCTGSQDLTLPQVGLTVRLFGLNTYNRFFFFIDYLSWLNNCVKNWEGAVPTPPWRNRFSLYKAACYFKIGMFKWINSLVLLANFKNTSEVQKGVEIINEFLFCF